MDKNKYGNTEVIKDCLHKLQHEFELMYGKDWHYFLLLQVQSGNTVRQHDLFQWLKEPWVKTPFPLFVDYDYAFENEKWILKGRCEGLD